MKFLLFLLALIIIAIFIVSYAIYDNIFVRQEDNGLLDTGPSASAEAFNKANEEGRNWLKENKETVTLEIGSFDGLKLRGLFIEGNRFKDKTIVCVHGYLTKNGLYDFGMSVRYLCSTGRNVLIVDDRAHGSSEGKYIGFSVLDAYDVVSWCKYLTDKMDQKTIVLYGISMGAATVLNAAGDEEMVSALKGVVSDCAYADGFKELSYQIKKRYHLPAFPFMYLTDMYLRHFADYSLKDKDPIRSIKNFKGALLLIHGNKDFLVPSSDVYALYDAADCDKDILVVDGASHGKSYITAKPIYESRFNELLEKADIL